MIYELLEGAIKNPSPYMDKLTIELQVEFFKVAGKLTQEEYDKLKLMLNPVEVIAE